jgi:beta-glucosidase/6-phospho-beta-glucosidase/beta-galactosidase
MGIMQKKRLFESFIMGGFECSTHRKRGGRRLDLIESTRHDEFAEDDYERMAKIGMRTARDGVRWHLIEREPLVYDFTSLEKQVRAMRAAGMQIIWDFFHYGFPDDLNIFSPEFIDRFARFAAATAEFLQSKTRGRLFICPVNEISFFSWAAGDIGLFYPFEKGRGSELKKQLVRATIHAIDAIRAVAPDARFVQTDPAIHVTTARQDARTRREAENYRRAQFEAFDMLTGRRDPELGGAPEYLDIIGLNYYFHNQWFYPNRRKIRRGHRLYRPFHEILGEYHERYRRPILIAETGTEDDERADWFGFVCREAQLALNAGVPLEGVCLYPILNHPGWDDDRHCHNGLWCYADDFGIRDVHEPLADEIAVQRERFEKPLFAAALI